MVSPEPTSPRTARTSATMANSKVSTARTLRPSILADGFVFAGGAAVALLLFWVLYSFLASGPGHGSALSSPFFDKPARDISSSSTAAAPGGSGCDGAGADLVSDPPGRTFYDDPALTYTVGSPVRGWDEKRREWLDRHPSFKPTGGGGERVLMLTGSQPRPCKNPGGDHLLLRLFKNKVDYCRIHGIELFYNTALLHPEMFSFWAKIPLVRAAMVAHPEAEWLWWVDSDAAFTDMEFKLPLHRYRGHNLVVHGWPHLVYEQRSWTSLNAGVFLIRNCQWSMDFLEVWASTGPQSPEYNRWGKTLRSEFKDKAFPESDDQSALVYLLLRHKDRWGDKIFLEGDYYFEGYWVEIVGRLHNFTSRYLDMERRSPALRRRRAEKVTEAHGAARDEVLRAEGWGSGRDGWRRPFVTHFTGCQPCSGDYNQHYSGENCWDSMHRALNFADDQVLRSYGFRHRDLRATADVRPLPFDFPGAG
uniref:Putative glycosyltransferase 7 n=1 Tax=Anthurium amnicola TaxID=1678845 RepID=A0A1D1XXU7_9ARAE